MKTEMRQNKIKYIVLSFGISLIVSGILLLIANTYFENYYKSQNDGSLPHDTSIDWMYHCNDKNIKFIPNNSKPNASCPVINKYKTRRM